MFCTHSHTFSGLVPVRDSPLGWHSTDTLSSTTSEARPKPSPAFAAAPKDRGHVQPLVNPRKTDMDESYALAAQYPAVSHRFV